MRAMHERENVIAYVNERATSWHGSGNASGVLVDLSIGCPLKNVPSVVATDWYKGFGPSFTWLLHEFTPAWPDLLWRVDSTWNEEEQLWKMTKCRSPPLGVQYLPASTGNSLERLLDKVIVDGLEDLAKSYDDVGDDFKPKILMLLCDLLSDLSNENTVRERDSMVVVSLLTAE